MSYLPSLPVLLPMIAEVIAAVVAIVYYFKYKKSSLKILPFYLVFMVINENLAWFYYWYNTFIKKEIRVNNLIFFNIYSIVTAYVFIHIFYKSIKNKTAKTAVFGMGVLYAIICIINSFYHSFRYEMTDIPDIVLSFIIVIITIIYLSEILNSDQIIVINKVLLFWISIALLLYYLPVVPFQVVAKIHRYAKLVPQFYIINSLLAGTYYIIFILGFIWSGKNQKD